MPDPYRTNHEAYLRADLDTGEVKVVGVRADLRWNVRDVTDLLLPSGEPTYAV